MDKKKANVPKIRFPGFTEEWERRKLGEVFNQTLEYINPQTENIELWSLTVENGLTQKTDRYVRDFLVKKSDKYKAVCVNDVIYNPMNMTLGAIGYNDMSKTVAVSGYYVTMKPSKEIDGYYIQIWMKNPQSIDLYKKHATGSLIEKQRVQYPTFARITFNLPTIEEQKRIGAFFKSFDNLIALHQRKLSHLKAKKKGLLQKMFPKDGEDVPELRFPGFTETWEQRRLEEIYEKIRNAFVGTATPYYVENGHFYLESNNVKNGQINRNTEIFINDEFYEKQKENWLHTGDIVMVQSGHVGHTAVISEKLNNTAAHALIIIANPNKKTNPYFVNYQFQTQNAKYDIDNITTGNTIKHILSSEIKKFKIRLTSNAEQNLISEFFYNLDNLITLHQRKLTHLQEQKKALLQQMFV